MPTISQTKFGSKQKAAAVILALGVENSSAIYKYLRDTEIEQLTLEIAIMQNVSAEVVESTLNEFYELCLAQKFITEGGIEYAKAVLEKAMGTSNAAGVIERITKSLSNRAFDFLTKADPKNLLSLIQNEHPQTIALILSYCSTAQASAVLIELPREIQLDVTKRIANMDRTSPEIIKDVEKVLERKLSSSDTSDFTEIGGIKYIAEILNSVDTSTEKFIMEELGNKDPVLADEIRKHMFVFDDIAKLDPISIQRFLQDVNSKDLLIALKGSNEEVTNAFYTNMSTRMREIMSEDAKYLRGVRMSDVEESQQNLVALARKLEESGDIFISRGRKDEIIV
ncbi:MAG: fliG [Clostridia bacterium]|nr:fliG [Clostridia bacterium]